MRGHGARPFEVSGAVHLQPALVARLWHEGLRGQGQAVTALRLENFAKSVRLSQGQAERACSRPTARSTSSTRENSLALLGRAAPALGAAGQRCAALAHLDHRRRRGPKVVAAISAYMECRAFYDWSGGLVWAEVLPTTDAGAADVRRVIATHGGHATLIRAEPQVRAAVEVFQPLEAGLEQLSRKLKAAFDPAGILNPGRMYANL